MQSAQERNKGQRGPQPPNNLPFFLYEVQTTANRIGIIKFFIFTVYTNTVSNTCEKSQ